MSDDLRDAIASTIIDSLARPTPSITDTADAILALPEMVARERVIEAARAWLWDVDGLGVMACDDNLRDTVADLDALSTHDQGRVSDRPVNRPLVDDLADVLSRMVVGWGPDLAQHPDVVRVMARYRETKGAA